MIPKPLPPHSPRLRTLRYEVTLFAAPYGPENRRKPLTSQSRFSNLQDAMRWAWLLAQRTDGDTVQIVLYAQPTWRGVNVGSLPCYDARPDSWAEQSSITAQRWESVFYEMTNQ